MAANSIVPVPKELQIREGNASENWKKFETQWKYYEIAAEFAKADEPVRVTAPLTVIGEEAVEVFETFEWAKVDDKDQIKEVLRKFKDYCISRSNVLFKTFRFGSWKQEAGETIDCYVTALSRLAAGCEFSDKDRRIRDQVVLGMKDDRVRERILREANPDLKKVVDYIRASETAERQTLEMAEGNVQAELNRVGGKSQQRKEKSEPPNMQAKRENQEEKRQVDCWFCGRMHERRKSFAQRGTKTAINAKTLKT
jgi:hypothetical protein